MKMSDEEVIDRIREVLVVWANEEPIAEPRLMAPQGASETMMFVEADRVSPIARRR